MPISVVCSGCGRRFSAPEKGAGKKVPCPNCTTTISIPAILRPADDDDYQLAREEPPQPSQRAAAPRPISAKPAAPAALPRTAAPANTRAVARGPAPAKTPAVTPPPPSPTSATDKARPGWVPTTHSSTPTWLRHLHWCLALALVPLAISIFIPNETPDQLVERVLRSLEENEPVAAASTETAASAPTPPPTDPSAASSDQSTSPDAAAPSDASSPGRLLEELTLDDVMALIPGQKLEGALLARDSYMHWLFALISTAAFLTFFLLLASDRSAKPLHLVGLGGFTATFGVLLLLIVQALSSVGYIGGRGIVAVILLLLLLIGMSYSAALDPDTGFFASFAGFTLGVGLCEELIKALPLLVYYRIGNQQNWRGAFLWGLASGAGFGVAEGVMYSRDLYNGIAGPGIYVVRFFSCVALHAVWTGTVGISINQRRDLLENEEEEWWMYIVHALRLIAIPMVLHGLYDTLLKKELDLLALLVAIASFGYLAWTISRLRTSDDEDERAAYVANYIRAKSAARRGS